MYVKTDSNGIFSSIQNEVVIIWRVLVTDAPTVTSGASLVEHGEGDVAHLSCAIDANPLDASMVKWSKNGGELNETNTRTRVSFSDDKSYLTIEGVDKSDVGTYTCSVDNGVVPPSTENGTGISNSSSSSSSASVFLVVKRELELFMYN